MWGKPESHVGDVMRWLYIKTRFKTTVMQHETTTCFVNQTLQGNERRIKEECREHLFTHVGNIGKVTFFYAPPASAARRGCASHMKGKEVQIPWREQHVMHAASSNEKLPAHHRHLARDAEQTTDRRNPCVYLEGYSLLVW